MIWPEYKEEEIKWSQDLTGWMLPKFAFYQGNIVRCNEEGSCWSWHPYINICGMSESNPLIKVYDIKRKD